MIKFICIILIAIVIAFVGFVLLYLLVTHPFRFLGVAVLFIIYQIAVNIYYDIFDK